MVARKPTLELDEDFWDAVMDLNLKSVYLVSKATIPYMKSGAAIVNLSSLAGRDGGGPGASAYATAKGGIMTYTRSLAKELGPKNIRVNAVLPGMIATTFHDTFSKPEVRVNVANATLLKREGTASEVADLVIYLASDQSSYITGANIDINGGLNFS
ncbi:Cyclopentanol dehydrogenase [compost metagenome]